LQKIIGCGAEIEVLTKRQQHFPNSFGSVSHSMNWRSDHKLAE
jgi:hypothetical protein